MRKVKIIGKLKKFEDKKIIVEKFEKEGWLKNNTIFYPNKDNPREFFKATECSKAWDNGILIQKMFDCEEVKKETKKKKRKSTKVEKEEIKEDICDEENNNEIEKEVKEDIKEEN